MNFLILFIKGLIIGIGKIIPGVSGSVIAISLNVYNKAILSIENVFKDFKNSFKYLLPLGLGIIITIALFSKIILYFITSNYMVTISIIIGLITGTLPNFIKNIKININSFIYLIILLFAFLILYNLKISINVDNIISYFILGLVEAITTIVPGISSTAIYINFNVYNIFLNIFKNPLTFKFAIFAIGILIGVFYTSKLINYLFKKYNYETNLIIFSLVISSVFSLFKLINFSFFNLFFLLLGFVISYMLDK